MPDKDWEKEAKYWQGVYIAERKEHAVTRKDYSNTMHADRDRFSAEVRSIRRFFILSYLVGMQFALMLGWVVGRIW